MNVGRGAKEPVHYRQPELRMYARKKFLGNGKICQEEIRIRRRSLHDLSDDPVDFVLPKAIENKIRDQKIIAARRRPTGDISVKKCGAIESVRQKLAQTFASQFQHPRARIDTIDLGTGVDAQEFAKKKAIALAQNENVSRWSDRFNPSGARVLQSMPEGHGFQPAVMSGDAIEAHKTNSAHKNATGVRRTKSASAVRSSCWIDTK